MNSKELLKKEHIKKKPWHISQASSSQVCLYSVPQLNFRFS